MLYPLRLLEGFAAMICTKLADNKEEEVPLQVVRLLLVLLDQASYVVLALLHSMPLPCSFPFFLRIVGYVT